MPACARFLHALFPAACRSIIVLATLAIVLGSDFLHPGHAAAVENGVEPREVGEVVTHLAFYSGWPN
ncbi:carboxymuconolactone decarboxylase family protein, partial [Rhizobium leguminosarum]|uniref:carboxymuconolactone decarboxylase family protein n=1 Tax=Rhizobium leguminosarum TaxID=384 RepID=UPI003F94D6DD